jgi:hypothetical protein
MIKILLSTLFFLPLFANVSVPGDTYKKIDQDGIELLYASEYETLSHKVLDFESTLIESYTKSFGYSLDDRQYLGLLSSHNQVANAYSSQFPLNLQMNFDGGAMAVDYFASSSWIEMLLLHESAHNFQLNPKKNLLSYYAHKVVKNSFLTALIVPIFPIPNLAESSFILEGNAVLNESWHNRGGRLYNGSLLAMTLTQARAGYITPARTYNNHLYFPYGTHHYIVGGFFQLFLAQRYGIDKVNSYFYNFSGQWIPIFTNSVFKETFGEDFETLLAEYNQWLLSEYADFKPTKGKEVFRSKSRLKLNSDKDEVYFLTSDHLVAPTLIRYIKKSKEYIKQKGNFPLGKVFKKSGKFYTVASRYTSPTAIMIGLYDQDGEILEGTQSKAVQSLHGDKMVYFDIPNSFDKPQMMVDGRYYATVNSSVFTDYHDNHYYFIQEGKKRTLYKNREKLFSMQGYYGFVCDVDADTIYFIANSKNGSSLYSYHDRTISRQLAGDDIVDARLIGEGKALVETIDAEGMSFKEVSLVATQVSSMAEVRYFFEDDPRFQMPIKEHNISKSKLYKPLENLHYSSLTQSITSNADGIDYDISANFSDPLSQNSINIFSSKIVDDTIAGIAYNSSAYRVNFGASLFGTLSHDENISSRGYGTYLYISYPLMHNTYEYLSLRLSYLLEDDKAEKEPLTLALNYSDHKHFGQSMYINEANDFSFAFGLDRGDKSAGATYHYSTSFAHQFYAGFNLKGALSDVGDSGKKRGLRVQQYQTRFSNALNFEMPSISYDIYVKNIVNAALFVEKVFDIDKYFFTFPISLRREALYGKYNYYNMEFLNAKREDFHELTVGVRADMLYFNSLALPISVEYIYNDKLNNPNEFRVLFDLSL